MPRFLLAAFVLAVLLAPLIVALLAFPDTP
jgi:hypothetical protein